MFKYLPPLLPLQDVFHHQSQREEEEQASFSSPDLLQGVTVVTWEVTVGRVLL